MRLSGADTGGVGVAAPCYYTFFHAHSAHAHWYFGPHHHRYLPTVCVQTPTVAFEPLLGGAVTA